MAGVKAKHSTEAQYKSSGGRRSVQRKTEEMAAQQCTVLITGANRGLGLEMVKQMLERSHSVKKLFACCRDPDGPKAEVRVLTSSVAH